MSNAVKVGSYIKVVTTGFRKSETGVMRVRAVCPTAHLDLVDSQGQSHWVTIGRDEEIRTATHPEIEQFDKTLTATITSLLNIAKNE